jgi:hypothetical protein
MQTTRQYKQQSPEALKRSGPRAALSAGLALASLIGGALLLHKAVADGSAPLTLILVLGAVIAVYVWALHRMFLYHSGDGDKAAFRTLIAVIATVLLAIAVLVTIEALLAGLSALFGGDSDDSEGSEGSSDSGSGWHFGSSSSGGGWGGQASSEPPMRGGGGSHGESGGSGVCGGCGRHIGSSAYGLCAACSMPRY